MKGSDRQCMVVDLSIVVLWTKFPKQLISLLKNFVYIFCRCYLIINKNSILKTYPPKFMILNVDFALKLSKYTS